MSAAVVERRRHERTHQRDEATHRIIGALGVSDVSLLPGDDERAVERAAPADFDGIADDGCVAWLPKDAVIERFTTLAGPFEQLGGAVYGNAFLVPGNEKRNRSFRFSRACSDIIEDSRNLAGYASLHIDRTASVEHALSDLPCKGRMVPFGLVARRHDIRMPRKDEVGSARPDTGIEILDRHGAGLSKNHPMPVDTGGFEHALDERKCTALGWRHRWTANEVARQGNGIDGHSMDRNQSRSNSLFDVFARVFSSTRLTITAQ